MNKQLLVLALCAVTATCVADIPPVAPKSCAICACAGKACAWTASTACALGAWTAAKAAPVTNFVAKQYDTTKLFVGNHKKAVIITSAVVGTAVVAGIVYKLVKKHNAKKANRCECCQECSCQSCNAFAEEVTA